MEKIVKFLKLALSVLTAIVVTIGGLTSSGGEKTPGHTLRLTAVLVSDTHITNELYRRLVFVPGIHDISVNIQPDLFLCAGDNTDNGNEENWKALQRLLNQYLKADEIILALGNHDTWLSYEEDDHEYEPARDNYLRFTNALMGTENTQVYFKREIKGYTFLVMGTEDSTTDATISEAQVQWLAQEMKAAYEAAPDKPIFVVNHHPLNFTHTVGDNMDEHGFADQRINDRVRAILSQYPNVVYISGHQHYALCMAGESSPHPGFQTVEVLDNTVTSLNLPCFTSGDFLEEDNRGTGLLGQGLVLYVYDDCIELWGRNFALNHWFEGFHVTIPLTNVENE